MINCGFPRSSGLNLLKILFRYKWLKRCSKLGNSIMFLQWVAYGKGHRTENLWFVFKTKVDPSWSPFNFLETTYYLGCEFLISYLRVVYFRDKIFLWYFKRVYLWKRIAKIWACSAVPVVSGTLDTLARRTEPCFILCVCEWKKSFILFSLFCHLHTTALLQT